MILHYITPRRHAREIRYTYATLLPLHYITRSLFTPLPRHAVITTLLLPLIIYYRYYAAAVIEHYAAITPLLLTLFTPPPLRHAIIVIFFFFIFLMLLYRFSQDITIHIIINIHTIRE